MKTDAGKCLTVCLCFFVVASRSCFHVRRRTLAAGVKAQEVFGRKTSGSDDNDTTAATTTPARDESPQHRSTGHDGQTLHPLFRVNWKNVGSEIANNWWIIAVSSLLPFAVLLRRVQNNMRKRIVEWNKSLIENERPFAPRSRRLTLPDLTLARHARRESMAEATHKLTGRTRKPCNVSQFRSTRKSSFEKNDSSGDTKRIHYIIRRGN